jgi:hypothetical protein
MKILISTAATQTLVVFPEGCTASDPPNCGELRGGEFLFNQSKTWVNNIVDSTNTFTLNLEPSFGYSASGEYGFDTITLGELGGGGPTLTNQIVAGIKITNFSLGLFGISPKNSTFVTSGDLIPSYLQNLKSQELIPSTSWSYTAGNQYREFKRSTYSKLCRLKASIRS